MLLICVFSMPIKSPDVGRTLWLEMAVHGPIFVECCALGGPR